RKGDPGFTVKAKRALFHEPGTQLRVSRLLDGIRTLSGEKIQWYLAAELRDRIRQTGVRITVVDKISRKQHAVEPRQYEGRLLHQLPNVRSEQGDAYVELYLNEPKETNRVALFRRGTRVFEDICVMEALAKPPWITRYLQGHIDAPFINLTPGTRSGIIHDEAYGALLDALLPTEEKPKKKKPAVNSFRQSSAHFAKHSSHCRKSMTGSIFIPARTAAQASAGAQPLLTTKVSLALSSLKAVTANSGSSSSSPARFSAL